MPNICAISITFDRPMNPVSVNAHHGRMAANGIQIGVRTRSPHPLSPSRRPDGLTATFTPSSALAPNATCQIAVSGFTTGAQ